VLQVALPGDSLVDTLWPVALVFCRHMLTPVPEVSETWEGFGTFFGNADKRLKVFVNMMSA
jgi:hypothetical protein